MAGYTRQASANIQPNLNINAEDFNAEFNQLQLAFDALQGHKHDGSLGGGAPIGRIKLTGPTTFYVSPAGNDNNNGLTALTPWLTLQHGWNILQNNYDLGGQSVIIQLADGTYTSGLVAAAPLVGQSFGAFNTAPSVTIQGNLVSPDNVIFNVATSGGVFYANSGGQFYVSGMKILSTGSGILAQSYGRVDYGIVDFGTCTFAHVQASNLGIAVATGVGGGYTISGGGSAHWSSFQQGFLYVNNNNPSLIVTLSGTPAFSVAFAACQNISELTIGPSVSFVGSATGQRYISSYNSLLNTNGAGTTYFPGNIAGVPATPNTPGPTGGIYF